ncbi:hypothetical protein PIB30_053467 [Stylosanthes scabra]|uniref:Uncharacterized protein n=1 Tax=Stylosanthes scabra TaxID=79078 RepID=A0ABU6VLM5_9FABA|nr:hypothetical protein [Stylosanthes scabra]
MEVGGDDGCCCRCYCSLRRGRKTLLLVDFVAAATGGVGPSHCGRERKEWWSHKRTMVEGNVGATVSGVPGASSASTKKKGAASKPNFNCVGVSMVMDFSGDGLKDGEDEHEKKRRNMWMM